MYFLFSKGSREKWLQEQWGYFECYLKERAFGSDGSWFKVDWSVWRDSVSRTDFGKWLGLNAIDRWSLGTGYEKGVWKLRPCSIDLIQIAFWSVQMSNRSQNAFPTGMNEDCASLLKKHTGMGVFLSSLKDPINFQKAFL